LCFTRGVHCSFELTRDRIEVAKIAWPPRGARITSYIRFLALNCLFQFTGHDLVVEIRDARAFIFTDAVAQRERLLHTLRGQSWLAGIGVLKCESQPGHGEVWIHFGGALIKFNRLEELPAVLFASAERIFLQGLER